MTSFGRYKLLYQLGAGGMAEVYLAHDTSLGGVERLVVIKRVLPALSQDSQFITMFLNEARISTRLNHPNIAHVYDVGQHEGEFFLAMEFVHGVDLGHVLRRNTLLLTPALAALIASRVAAALHHAHQLTDLHGTPLNVVHRDVSPQNIRVGYDGVVKVLDFGIAKASSNVDTTQSGVIKGKYPYMSPEQIDGQSLDCRTDIFSLGIVLHEMLTYRRLFKRESTVHTLKEISHGRIPLPSEAAKRPIPGEIERIVMRALDRDREARYASARDLQRDLDVFLRLYPATDADLEEFMAKLFGSAATLRATLLEAVGADRLDDLFGHTPSTTLPTITPSAPRPPKEGTTLGSAAAEISSRSLSRSRWPLAAAALFLAAGTAVGVYLLQSPTVPTTVAAAPTRPDSRRLTSSSTAAVARDAGRPATSPPPPPVDAEPDRKPRKPPRGLPTKLAPVRKVEAKTAPAAKIEAGFGELSVNSTPWSINSIDGTRVGITPLFRHRLASGRHQLELRNPDKNLSRTLSIEVPRDGMVKKTVTLE